MVARYSYLLTNYVSKSGAMHDARNNQKIERKYN